jgi:BirA family biotin operon repressor/biotin-[acetyl-CoA-carboxylase] ligase
VAALRAEAGVPAGLKWPNDVLVADRKIAGILAEAHDDAIVVGIGLNVTLTAAELPVPGATSLLLEDAACLDRERLLAAMLTGLADRYRTWAAGPGAAVPGAGGLRAEYLRWCVTVGREIRVELPTGPPLTGTAADVDESGRLAVRTGSGTTLVGAGDVVHVR